MADWPHPPDDFDYADGMDDVHCPVTGSYCSDRQSDLCADYGCWKLARRACPPSKMKRVIRNHKDGTPDLFDAPLSPEQRAEGEKP